MRENQLQFKNNNIKLNINSIFIFCLCNRQFLLFELPTEKKTNLGIKLKRGKKNLLRHS